MATFNEQESTISILLCDGILPRASLCLKRQQILRREKHSKLAQKEIEHTTQHLLIAESLFHPNNTVI